MKTNFLGLIEVQKEVNQVVADRLDESGLKQPDIIDYLVAMHVEFFEFINEIGIWKWWKQSHKLNKERVLDELADIMAFFLSILSLEVNDDQKTIDAAMDELEDLLGQYETKEIIRSISFDMENDTHSTLSYAVLMGVSIELARKTVDATWEDIEVAYRKKSEENIKRQKNGY